MTVTAEDWGNRDLRGWGGIVRQQIADRNDNLDISWLKDTSNDPEDDLTEPEEIAEAIANHLTNALREIESLVDEFSTNG